MDQVKKEAHLVETQLKHGSWGRSSICFFELHLNLPLSLRKLVAFIKELSLMINFQKSDLTPTRHFDFCGYRFNLSKGEMSSTEEKRGVS